MARRALESCRIGSLLLRNRIVMAPVTTQYAGARGAVTEQLKAHYETRADVRVLAALGADVVGMSCAVEVRAARAAGLALRVVAIVTNRAGETHTDHEAVLREAARAAGGAARLVLPV